MFSQVHHVLLYNCLALYKLFVTINDDGDADAAKH